MTTKPIAPPDMFSLEAERAVLGSLLIDPAAWPTVSAILSAPDFYDSTGRSIFAAIAECARTSQIDHLTVADALDRSGDLERAGGMAGLVALMNLVPSAMMAEHYARIVRDYSLRRALLAAAGNIGRAVYDVEMPSAKVQASAEALVLACRRDTADHRHSAASAASAALDAMRNVNAITTGLPSLDVVLGGLEPGVYIVAARPSMGKSAFLAQMLSGLARAGQRCVLFTIEMSASQVTQRLASSVARVPLQMLKQQKATPEQRALYGDALGQIAEWPVTVIDKSEVRSADVLAEVRREQIEHVQVAAVLVDGLWLMQPAQRHATRLAEVGEISRDMKRVQQELGIPIIMAHQLSRACEGRGDRRPILSDLRETGDVEQDADVVLMLYREGYYNPKHKEANVMEVWLRKNRLNGPAGEVVKLFWNGSVMRCEPLTREEQ